MAPISNINVGAFVANIAAHQDAGHTAGLDPKFNQPKWELFKDKDFTDILVNAGGQALLNAVYNAAPKTQDLMCVLSFAETFHLDAGEIRALADEIRPLPNASKNPAHVINSAVIQGKMAGMNHVQTQVQEARADVNQFVAGMLGGAGVQTHPSMKTNPHKQLFTNEIRNAFNKGTPISQHNPILNLTVRQGLSVRAAFDRFNQLQAQLRNMPRVNDLQAQAAANFAKLNEVVGDPRFRPVVVGGGHAGAAVFGVAKGPGPKVAPKMPPRPAKGAGKAPGAAPKGAPMPKAPGPVVGAAPPPPPPMPKAAGAPPKMPPPPPVDELEPLAGPFEGMDFDKEFDPVVMEEYVVAHDEAPEVLAPPAENIPPPPGDVVHPPEDEAPQAEPARPEVSSLLAQIRAGKQLKPVEPKAPGAAAPKAGMAGALNQALNNRRDLIAQSDDEDDSNDDSDWN
jgi:hypothetical protein